MPLVVGVSFRRAGKVYYFDPNGVELKTSDRVIVKTTRGTECGEVVSAPEEIPDEEIPTPLKRIVRKATTEDLEKVERNRAKEQEAVKVCNEKIAKHKLDMKLIDAEYVFDGNKLVFCFTAENRVDFRDLVKDLASVFKTRIELRQIGVRDEAKMVGGLGQCGRRLCCTLFSGDFDPVSIRMAKEQDLPLNPLKISGACGRLMCCLKYEVEAYKDFKKRAPKRGEQVRTADGVATVLDYSVPRERLTVAYETGLRANVNLADVTLMKKPGEDGKKGAEGAGRKKDESAGRKFDPGDKSDGGGKSDRGDKSEGGGEPGLGEQSAESAESDGHAKSDAVGSPNGGHEAALGAEANGGGAPQGCGAGSCANGNGCGCLSEPS